MKYIKNILLPILIICAFEGTPYAQKNTAPDSLLIYLNNIKSAKDSVNIEMSFTWLYRCSAQTLLNDSVVKRIYDLKGRLDEKDYLDLLQVYFQELTSTNTPATNEKAISFGKNFVAQYQKNRTKYSHYIFLTILRNLRIAFRNSGKSNEAIEYYSSFDKNYPAMNDSATESVVNNVLAGSYFRLGLVEKAKYYQLKSISYLNDAQVDYDLHIGATLIGLAGKINRYAVLGSYYISEKKPGIAEPYFKEAIRLYKQLNAPLLMSDVPFLFLQMARCKTLEKNPNSASYYDTASGYFKLYESSKLEYAHFYQEKGVDFISKDQFDSAIYYIGKTRKLKDSFHFPISSYMGEIQPDYYSATICLKQGNPKEAIGYLQKESNELRSFDLRTLLISDLVLLANAYTAAGQPGEAYITLSEAFSMKEKVLANENEARSMNFETEKKMQEGETTILLLDEQNKNNKKIKYYLVGIVSILGLLAVTLGIFYSNKRKNNRQLHVKNEKLALALEQLKATQSQLVQSEKMASLGELTAGIAHEIQNPLNFVNNFSEVNTELIEELVEEADKGNIAEVKVIAKDIKENEQKINHHGKRADAIVKGMLQHSRSSTGQKEPTDINALCDEYLRLSYHGLRAKDKSFNATIKTDFDPSIGKINIISQDIGRVILNLLNNAFYAVAEKKKMSIPGYEATVTVSTNCSPLLRRGVGGEVRITVTDNGNGIPQKVLEKIFQPFFTTKPTGLGTGLGLSLSYDIITKGHGGELKVETKESEGTSFIIIIPA